MNIIITGLEMPTERESFNLTIKYNGTVLDTETGMQVAEAHELPPHGRLIDADALKVKAIEKSEKCGVCVNVLDKVITAYDIETAPTIIPASEE